VIIAEVKFDRFIRDILAVALEILTIMDVALGDRVRCHGRARGYRDDCGELPHRIALPCGEAPWPKRDLL
jgi:hypothetical protein